MGNLCSSMESSVRSARSNEPSLMACAGRSMSAMRTLGLVRAAEPTTCWAVMKALAQVDAIAGPGLWWVLHDVDRVEAQGVVGGVGVRNAKQYQRRRCQEESDRKAHSFAWVQMRIGRGPCHTQHKSPASGVNRCRREAQSLFTSWPEAYP